MWYWLKIKRGKAARQKIQEKGLMEEYGEFHHIPWYYVNTREWGLSFKVVANHAFRGIAFRLLCIEFVLGWYKTDTKQ